MVWRLQRPQRSVVVMMDRETRDRFWKKVCLDLGPKSCWEWTASKLRDGYGSFKLDGRRQSAHRVAWQLVNGPIPRGEGAHGTCVLHHCDNPACVRPGHLFLGTNADNVRDREEKGRGAAATGEANNAVKLTKEQVYAIRADTRSQRKIAADHGVSPAQVYRIKRRKNWAHLPEAVT